MLDVGVFFAVLLSGSVFAAARFGRKFEEILPITCMGIVLVLFLLGAVGILGAGVYAVLIAAVCFWAYGLWRLVKGGGKQLIKSMVTPVFIVFCVIFALLMLGDYGMLSTGWDDFSHWQLCVRKMMELNDFAANPASGIYYQSYPPAMALFQYFFQKLHYMLDSVPDFSEWRLFLAYQVLMLTPALPFFRGLSLRKAALAGMCLFILPMIGFAQTYALLYVDSIVGVLAGCGFLAVLLKDRGGLHTAYVAMLCAVLTLSKDVGLYFSCFIGIAFFLNRLLTRGNEKSLRRAGAALLPLISALCAKLAWKGILLKLGSRLVFSEPIDLVEYTKMFFFKSGTGFQQECVDAFKRMFFAREFVISGSGITISFFSVTIGLAFFTYILCGNLMRIQPERAKSIRMVGIVLMVQIVVYVYCLGATYAYRFSEREASALASYNRYMSIAYLSALLPLVLGAFLLLSRRKDTLPLLFLCAALLFIAPMNEVCRFVNRDAVADSYAIREPLQQLVLDLQENCTETDKVYLVSQGSAGREGITMSSQTKKGQISSSLGVSFGVPIDENSWDVDVSPEQWHDVLLKEYDYVVVCNLNSYFIKNFSYLFENSENVEANTLYRLDRQSGLLSPCAHVDIPQE